jgi:hypothetical protein
VEVGDFPLFMYTGRRFMAKKLPGSSRPAGLTSMKSEDIKNRKWTEAERALMKPKARAI